MLRNFHAVNINKLTRGLKRSLQFTNCMSGVLRVRHGCWLTGRVTWSSLLENIDFFFLFIFAEILVLGLRRLCIRIEVGGETVLCVL
jgi:hypothetical protein